MQGTWADIQGVRTYVGDQTVPIGDQPFGDIIKFLEAYNFVDQETTNLPSGSANPASERTFQHRDGRSVMLVQRFGPWGIPSIDSISGSDGDVAEHQFPMKSVGDLVKFVIGGRKTDDPEKPAIMDQGQDNVSSAIGSVYGKVEPVSVPSSYSPKSFTRIGLAVRKTYPGCGHMKKEEGCVLCEEGGPGSGRRPYGGQQAPYPKVPRGASSGLDLYGRRSEESELGPTAGILPTGVKPAEVAKSQAGDVYQGQAQDPVAGGQSYMEQGSDQSRAMGRDGSLNPMYGGQQTPKVTFEEIMQSPAYTSDDGLDIWNTYRQEDLEPPDEVRITLDPITGEVMQVTYGNPDAEQLPFMGTPAMPINPFADSPKPTPMTEEAPQKQTSDTAMGGAGQRPSGMGGGQMGQPHAQPQVPGPSTSQPTQSQPQKQSPQQSSSPEQASKPQPLSPDQLMQTPQTPQWTSPDPTSNEESGAGQSNQGQKQPSPNIQLQRSFRKFSRYGK